MSPENRPVLATRTRTDTGTFPRVSGLQSVSQEAARPAVSGTSATRSTCCAVLASMGSGPTSLAALRRGQQDHKDIPCPTRSARDRASWTSLFMRAGQPRYQGATMR